mmetsp:Transcript_11437/g.36628  ORF Transcript_11437/g.36628 Transcript_11437/m.36628 type:complete len:100 (-) Transcript_11437:2047-2346(-)
MSMLDPKFPAARLAVPKVTVQDLRNALAELKPSVDQADIRQFVDFAKSFGDKPVEEMEDVEALPVAPTGAPAPRVGQASYSRHRHESDEEEDSRRMVAM